jgi:hypothetical protein
MGGSVKLKLIVERWTLGCECGVKLLQRERKEGAKEEDELRYKPS